MFTLNSYAPDRFFDLSPDQIAAFTDREAMDAVLAAREVVCRAEAIQARATARLIRIRPDAQGVADELPAPGRTWPPPPPTRPHLPPRRKNRRETRTDNETRG
jgi:hypothetical protein